MAQTTAGTQSVRIEGRQQFVTYTEHYRYVNNAMTIKETVHTLRVVVRLGGYADQSWGMVERWNGNAWEEIVTIAGSALQTDLHVGYKSHGPVNGDFAADRDRLLQLAKEIL